MNFKNTIFKSFGTLALVLLTVTFAMAKGDADKVLGTWLVGDEKDAHIEVYKCGDKYCGKIVWIQKEKDANGNVRTDTNNPDKTLRKRSIKGMQIMEGFTYDSGSDEWNNGTIYNSRNGKTYSGYMQLQKDGSLYLKGYVMGMRFLGKSQTWTRVE